MRLDVRRIALYSWLSFRALFNWLNPVAYVATLVVVPAFIGLLLIVISEQHHSDPVRPALGAAMLSTANAVFFGTSFAAMNERRFGTLRLWLATPQHTLESLLAKSAIQIVNGLVSGVVTFLLVAGLAGVGLHGRTGALLLVCELVAALGSAGVAVLSAAISLWTRDALSLPNAARSLILLASGAFIDPSALFVDVRWLSPFLPVHHAMAAALDAVHGRGTPWPDLGLELAVGIGWGVAGLLLFHRIIGLARTRNLMELD